MITLQNLGRSVYKFRCKDGSLFTIDDRQCRDVPNEIVPELLAEFPHLKVIYEDGVPMEIPIVVEEEKAVESEAPVDSFIAENKELVICNQCGDKFESIEGRSIHIGRKHK